MLFGIAVMSDKSLTRLVDLLQCYCHYAMEYSWMKGTSIRIALRLVQLSNLFEESSDMVFSFLYTGSTYK